VIEKLNLGPCRDTVIGTALQRGISGGQAKRVNIGLSLITRPAVLFLDEPTSGLDSHTANEVVLLLKQLAEEGRTVVCTIHSPTGLAFQQFDDLLMLREGRTIFEGPLSTARAYFEAMGHSANPNCSFPEWLVDLTSGRGSHFELQPTAPAADLEGGGSDSSKPSTDMDFAAAFEASSAKAAADAVRVQVCAQSRP
jgi:ATP-binding cassette subfamily G (WHITE) protein 2